MSSAYVPLGWELRQAPNKETYYVDHIFHRTTWDHPTSHEANNDAGFGLRVAIDSGDFDRFIEAANSGADVNAADPSRLDWAPLHRASITGNLEIVQELVNKGATLEQTDAAGNTALHLTCAFGHKNVGRFLCSRATPEYLHQKNNHGESALHCAAKFGHIENVKALLEAGATKVVIDHEGNFPFDVASTPKLCDLLQLSAEYLSIPKPERAAKLPEMEPSSSEWTMSPRQEKKSSNEPTRSKGPGIGNARSTGPRVASAPSSPCRGRGRARGSLREMPARPKPPLPGRGGKAASGRPLSAPPARIEPLRGRPNRGRARGGFIGNNKSERTASIVNTKTLYAQFGWETKIDTDSGRPFFHCIKSGEDSWTLPKDVAGKVQEPAVRSKPPLPKDKKPSVP